MATTFGIGQTFVAGVVGLAQTVEAFGGVEIELIGADQRLQFEEALDAFDLRPRILDEPVAVDDVQLPSWEDVQPAAQEFCVHRHV